MSEDNESDSNWMGRFNEFKKFVQENRALPNSKVNKSLQNWMNYQKKDIKKLEKIRNFLDQENIHHSFEKKRRANVWDIYYPILKYHLDNRIPTRLSTYPKFSLFLSDLNRNWKNCEWRFKTKSLYKVALLKEDNYENLIIKDMLEYENLINYINSGKDIELSLITDDIKSKVLHENYDDENSSLKNEEIEEIEIEDFEEELELENFKEKTEDFEEELELEEFEDKEYSIQYIFEPAKFILKKRKSTKLNEHQKDILSFCEKYNLKLNISQQKIKLIVCDLIGKNIYYDENKEIMKKLFKIAVDNDLKNFNNDIVLSLIDIFDKKLTDIANETNYSRERIRQLFERVLKEFKLVVSDNHNLFNNSLSMPLYNRKNLEENELSEKIINIEIKSNTIYSENLIYYGAPGTGKSFIVDSLKADYIYRCMFHEEYTCHDFIGQYKPVMYTIDRNSKNTLYDELNNKISSDKEPIIVYTFIAGVFIQAYVEALKNPEKKCVLIIDEINRGNSASIFGDIFQLLDRDENGCSKYPISTSKELSKYLKDQGIENYNELRIPNNLSILGTMNTSDQSLFHMDTAFKRRWNLRYIPINYEESSLLNVYIENTRFKWLDVVKKINDLISLKLESENKCIGQWFIKPVGNVVKENDIRDKLLHYLFFDVFNHDRLAVFQTVQFSNIYNKEINSLIEDIYNNHD